MVSVKAVDPAHRRHLLHIRREDVRTSRALLTVSSDGMTMTQVVNGTTSKGKPFINTVVMRAAAVARAHFFSRAAEMADRDRITPPRPATRAPPPTSGVGARSSILLL